MAIRVVARIRPRQANELGQDIIVTTATATATSISKACRSEEGGDCITTSGAPTPTLVRIPSPKNENEDFTFQFSGVYDEGASQQVIFDREGWFQCISFKNIKRVGRGGITMHLFTSFLLQLSMVIS